MLFKIISQQMLFICRPGFHKKTTPIQSGWSYKQLVCTIETGGKAGEFLFYIKRKHAGIFKKTFQLISHHRFTNTCRGTCKDHIANVHRKEI
jgi:hypothetical protein